jgi:putative ABC transport system ATP-binding protein
MTTTLTPTTHAALDHAVAASVRDVTKTYGSGGTAVRALDHASLDIAAGQFTAVMGPSGSGKSTLMHVLAGLDDVDAGQVLLGETDVTTLSEKERTLLRRSRVGFVFQSFNLIPALTAEENIGLPLMLAGAKPDAAWFDQVVTMLGLTDRLSHRPTELSGGQQQRVAVARALVTRPDVVFADEPTGNLDSQHGHRLLEFLQHTAADFGQTIVMVTHDPTAASYADRVVFLVDGRVVDELADPTAAAVLATMARLANKED